VLVVSEAPCTFFDSIALTTQSLIPFERRGAKPVRDISKSLS